MSGSCAQSSGMGHAWAHEMQEEAEVCMHEKRSAAWAFERGVLSGRPDANTAYYNIVMFSLPSAKAQTIIELLS
jgi:hypothetical protein